MCTTYTTFQDENAMLRVFMRLQDNNTGFEMPMYVTYVLMCGRLQVINIGFKMVIYTRSVQKVSGLPLYLRAGVILYYRAGGILHSNRHLIE